MSEDKVKGPASYFPSIIKTYGQPIAHWEAVIETQLDKPHMQIVNHLKAAHGLGHGHANALVAYALAKKKGA
jgi:Domain of unknown function (DUF4287)